LIDEKENRLLLRRCRSAANMNGSALIARIVQ
jgi:hypothetical protein